ncbi:retrovirus-related pol polyprotein from transposon tnt 1-94, partial [Nicotiana attenuata]
LYYLGDSPISWSSKKQHSVSLSPTEAEYRAVATTTSEVVWLKNLLRELHFPLSSPRILCNNMSTTYICANLAFHSRMKHVEIDFHFVCQLVQSKVLEVHHLYAADQVADILMKPLPSSAFLRMYPNLGLV